MKLVYESLNEFGKGTDPKQTLDIGKDYYKKEIENLLTNFISKIQHHDIKLTFVWDEYSLDIVFPKNFKFGKHYLIQVANELLNNDLEIEKFEQFNTNLKYLNKIYRNFRIEASDDAWDTIVIGFIDYINESLNEFGKGNDPLKTMGLGRIAEAKKFFEKLEIDDSNYVIDTKGVIHYGQSLNINGEENIFELPDNLTIGGSLFLCRTNIVELPENLTILNALDLRETQITELPDTLHVRSRIFINLDQTELKEFILNSKWKMQALYFN